MDTFGRLSVAWLILALGSACVRADDEWTLQAEETPQPTQPNSAAPTTAPPPPPANIPAPPTASPDVSGQEAVPQQSTAGSEGEAQPSPPPGQWTFTAQYGWVWMPYGDDYTYVPSDGGSPDMYVYSPSVGWAWVIAPWIWGWGPMPYFGVYGPRFAWWGRGYGHWYGFQSGFNTWNGRGYFRGGQWSGYGRGSPAPPRSGYVHPTEQARAPGSAFAAPPRTGYGMAPRTGSSAPRGGFGGHGGGGFGGHGGGGGGHGGGGHR